MSDQSTDQRRKGGRIITIERWDRDDLFVPGVDPAQIIADGNAWLAANAGIMGADEMVVTTPPDEMRIGWYRVNPCGPSNCGDDHSGHWVETPEQTRGGFRGAMVAFGAPNEMPSAVTR